MHAAPATTPWGLLGGGVSAGIIVGVVSGLFYLVVAGIRWAGRLRDRAGAESGAGRPCEKCGGGADVPEGAECAGCGRRVCADCGAWRWATPPGGSWLCARCRELRQQTGDWLQQQASRRFRSVALSQRAGLDDDDGLGMETESSQVREFIEKLVEKLVSGGLDDVSVDKLHSHPAYKPLPEEDSPTAAHTALKKLIHDIIQEAMTLPAMQVDTRKAPVQGSYATEDEIALKTYEDILATAILNKVIERYQAHRFHNGSALDGNSNLVSASYSTVSMEQQTKYISSLEIGVKKVDDESLSSKEISESDSDEIHWKKSDVADPSLSLTIEERIEEVTTYSNSDCEEDNDDPDEKLFVPDLKLLQRRVPFPEFGMDIVEGEATGGNADGNDSLSDSSTEHKPTDIVSPVESWEENWLFQRRRLKTGVGATQMPVPMLVPNPSEDIRALIGDRDAEDISDLSECSDSVLEEMVLAEVEEKKSQKTDDSYMLKNDVLVPSLLDIGETSDFDVSTVIGNEVTANNNQNEELLIRITAPDEDESGIRNTDLDVREATNFELMKTSLDCSSEFGQKDSEYTEDFDAVTQRQMESLTNLSETETSTPPVPKPRSAVPNGETSGTVAEASSAEPDEINTASVLEEETLPYAAPPRPGTIAEREHKKWETAPPLPNNPYSPENISKRLKNRMQLSSSQSSSSEASVEFPDLKEETILPGPITEPLHIVCAPQDLDYKRYGRDYYVNAKKQHCEKKSQSSNQTLLKDMRPRNNTPKVSDDAGLPVSGLEKQILQRDIHQASLRSRSASPQFKMNPLYIPDEHGETEKETYKFLTKSKNRNENNKGTQQLTIGAKAMHNRPESGYSSSLDSLVDNQPASNFLRLTPPSVPQVVERTLEPLSKIRRSESFRLKRARHVDAPVVMGGSLRTRKFRGNDYLASFW